MESDAREDWGAAAECVQQVIEGRYPVAGTATAIVGWRLARRRGELVPLDGYAPVRTLTRRQRRVVRRQIRGQDLLSAASAPVVTALLRERNVSSRANQTTNSGFAIGLAGLGFSTSWVAVLTVVLVLAVWVATVASHRTDTRRLAAVERAFPSV